MQRAGPAHAASPYAEPPQQLVTPLHSCGPRYHWCSGLTPALLTGRDSELGFGQRDLRLGFRLPAPRVEDGEALGCVR